MTTPAQSAVAPGNGIPSVHNSTSGKFAAVAYLNMLPFFADAADVELFPTPRALNSSEQNCAAYCSSLVAGLAANKIPVTHQFGVFSSGPVLSVFIEPILHSESHATFWKQIEELWAHRHPDPVSGLKQAHAHGEIFLRSSGASEQSVWMLNVLCALAGFKTLTIRDDLPSTDSLNTSGKKNPEARLWIGDAALERRLAEPSAYRIDVGQIWNSHMGHRAWFAGWFTGQGQDNVLQEEFENEMDQRIKSWQGKSEFSRWCSIHAFLENQKRCLLKTSANDEQNWELRDALDEYFKALEFSISAEEGAMLCGFYTSILNAFAECDRRWAAGNEECSALPHPSVIPTTQPNLHC